LKIKNKPDNRAIPWQAWVVACLLVGAGIGVFLVTCKPQAQALSKFSAKLVGNQVQDTGASAAKSNVD